MAAASDTLPHVPSQPCLRHIGGFQHRRSLLGVLAAAPMAAAAPAVAEVITDPHPAWWAEYERLEALSSDVADGPAFKELLAEQLEVLEQIARTPATTAAGVLAQLHVVRLGIETGEAEFDADALENALGTLEQLAGRA